MLPRLAIGILLLSGVATADTLEEDTIRRSTVQHDEQYAVEASAFYAFAVGDHGADLFTLSADWHIFRALAISAGFYDLPGDGSQSGFFVGLEANPIGVGPVQTCVGVEGLLGEDFVASYYAGVRVELGRLRLSPRVTYTPRDDHDGFGLGLTVSYALWTQAP